jgi:predicted transcriptional regulator
MREVTLRVEDLDSFFEDALAMGRRLDEGANKAGVAKLAFESMAGLLKLLTANRWTLMATLRKLGPVSIPALAKALARDYRGVHADVALLTDAGLIVRDEHGKVSVPWSRITAEMDFGAAA